jgi:hypothetical protein
MKNFDLRFSRRRPNGGRRAGFRAWWPVRKHPDESYNLGAAYWTRSDFAEALMADRKVMTRENRCVFGVRQADNALFLVILPVHILPHPFRRC